MSLSLRHILHRYIGECNPKINEKSSAFLPSNIALCKYWGKRDSKLNLPLNNSLSLSLGHLGTITHITVIDSDADCIILNGQKISSQSSFFKKTTQFCDLFRQFSKVYFLIETSNNIPTKAGLASSASGFAALTLALFRIYSIPEKSESLSRVARLGSGSACRSFYRGFCEWICGTDQNGMDSFAVPFNNQWPDLRIGLLKIIDREKKIGSREAMEITRHHSPFFTQWTQQISTDLAHIKQAIIDQDFIKLGEVAEKNALKMHATMIAASPPLLYWQKETIQGMERVWDARQQSIPIYFTLDAGPNLKLLFTHKIEETIKQFFPEITIIDPLDSPDLWSTKDSLSQKNSIELGISK
ncbi:diphosphomevalonate decarboxylase [Candidatus Liberibacter asiaticus]|uniref:diphosphomevalonate decarboxylase n=2 Tax=Liberibacter asiaticus TaxID=34021 RepID=C6XGI6_LIBAP|nr:diphosphomevalonate decarboxylase [Candidatus Liberibacter asiaticus]ACT57489.1 diphosphomevalonate decarboxylase/isopentenyl-diphosphate delta-isomerase [Candidatus Liberibacter asiaticus str. psy62]AGH17255.1 diphosphomevalonate decarboxylase/isopentenyl-diphosphate delta-isomerase [Candidatus Liberibacter asiaticus str. gxpsy]ALK07549.1 diphosphomevalonate decarboxylase [Candidatus Liberibacter asiaticus]ASK53042.1 diphosphomevalonate decarboxylase [Candidatus Liberibacter asiaticus]AWL1